MFQANSAVWHLQEKLSVWPISHFPFLFESKGYYLAWEKPARENKNCQIYEALAASSSKKSGDYLEGGRANRHLPLCFSYDVLILQHCLSDQFIISDTTEFNKSEIYSGTILGQNLERFRWILWAYCGYSPKMSSQLTKWFPGRIYNYLKTYQDGFLSSLHHWRIFCLASCPTSSPWIHGQQSSWEQSPSCLSSWGLFGFQRILGDEDNRSWSFALHLLQISTFLYLTV